MPTFIPNSRREMINLMGGVCVACGFSDPRTLQLDRTAGTGEMVGWWLSLSRVRDHREDYQLLCANCAWIKRYESRQSIGRKPSLTKVYQTDRVAIMVKNLLKSGPQPLTSVVKDLAAALGCAERTAYAKIKALANANTVVLKPLGDGYNSKEVSLVDMP